MKSLFSTTCLILCLLTLVAGANAQNQINFSGLPLVNSPLPVPNGYAGFTWTNILYVDPAEWQLAAAGYKMAPVVNEDVAFVGGITCLIPSHGDDCFGSISINSGSGGSGGINNPIGFQLVSATVAGGFGPTSITVVAYNHGSYVGSAFYNLNGKLQTINFPASWGGVTDVTFQTEGMGDLVIYSMQAYWLLG